MTDQKITLNPGDTLTISVPATPAPAKDPVPSVPANDSTIPIGDLTGWKQVFAEDFSHDASTGSWDNGGDPHKVVYTGSRGGQWVTYPSSYNDTAGSPYRPAECLSVHDGMLDVYLHGVGGKDAGANPCPLVNPSASTPDGKMYQTYGRYSAKVKLDKLVSGYHLAWLLWPQNGADWDVGGESDFPEFDTNSSLVQAFHHAAGGQEAFNGPQPFDPTQWHVYTQYWTPTMRRYFIDGVQIGQTAKPVYQKPERWQLQCESKGGSTGNSCHVLVDWVVAYSYAP